MIRLATRTTQGLIDLAALSLAMWMAYWFRFEFSLDQQVFKRLMFAWPYVVLFEYVVLMIAGVPRYSWRYFGLHEATRTLGAIAISTAVIVGLRVTLPLVTETFPPAIYATLPFGVIAINFMLAVSGIVGVRIARRMLGERSEAVARKTDRTPGVPTILVGAGQAGVMVAREIHHWPGLHIEPVGFVDDAAVKQGTVVHGVPVLGSTHELQSLAEQTGARQALITIANAPGDVIRRIAKQCKSAGLTTKIIPGIYEILDGKVNLNRIRDVSVEDLLRRPAVELETDVIEASLGGQRLMITGAGGSIGSELCRQVARFAPESVALVERSEFHLFEIHRELVRRFPEIEWQPILCDVTDGERLDAVFSQVRPRVVLHAAAHKHVPMMERNPCEAIKNNVFGTRTVADLAVEHGAARFVLVSTDKAVNPTSVMGATKRVAELYLQSVSGASETRFCAVRFGNVLGSAGSVIPIFKQQIERGGPVTVTHPEMRRYFMTIPEAAQLVLQAGAMGEGGEIFVLDMGEPVKIVDLAHDLIRLSGLEPDLDVEVAFTGARPGEKLFEELGFDAERMTKTRHPKIFVGNLRAPRLEVVEAHLEALASLRACSDRARVRAALAEAVPEMQPDIEAEDTSVTEPSPHRERRRSRPVLAVAD